MITSFTIKLLYDYNDWANNRMLAACAGLTAERWDQSLGHSWGSARGLLTHIMAGEMIWLARWKGHSPKSVRPPAEFPTFADLRAAWQEHSVELRSFVNAVTDDSLSGDVAYTNTAGEGFNNPLGHLMLHLANHGTHHRGELAATLAVLDVPHLEDDLLYYLREK